MNALDFTSKMMKTPTKNVETDDIMDLLEDGYSHEAEMKVDAIITKLKADKYRQGKEWGKFELRGW